MHIRFFVLATLVLPCSVGAQLIKGPPPTAQQCDSAISALSAHNEKASWEWIGLCGDRAVPPIVQALSLATSENDTLYLKRLSAAASAIRNADIFSTSLQVLSNKSATVPARMAALFIAYAQRDNSVSKAASISWSSLISTPLGRGCPLIPGTDVTYFLSDALPSDYLNQLAHVLDFVSRDNSDAQVIRDWARCFRVLVVEAVSSIDPSLLKLRYVCGRQFRVTNSSDQTVAVKYRMTNGETATITATAGGDTDFFTTSIGPVTLEYLGQAIGTVANDGTPCP